MTKVQPEYYAYLLRLWRTDEDGPVTWLASLQDSRTGEETGFANLEALLEFLRQQTQIGRENDEGHNVP